MAKKKRRTSRAKKRPLARKQSKRTAKKSTKTGRTRAQRPAAALKNRYSEEYRRSVAEHSILHGIHAAAKKFGVSAPSVTNWRKALGITRATKRAAQAGKQVKISRTARTIRGEGRGYSEQYRREVADYSIINGIQRAAKQYQVSAPSVTSWRKNFGITRASKAKAIASISSSATSGSPRIAKGEVREVRKKLDGAFRALDRLLGKL